MLLILFAALYMVYLTMIKKGFIGTTLMIFASMFLIEGWLNGKMPPGQALSGAMLLSALLVSVVNEYAKRRDNL